MNSVLITGASSGFGEACARKFAAQGLRLVLCARRADRLSALADELSQITEVHSVILDVRDREAVFALPASLPAAFADVGILVNNAGLALGLGGADVASVDDWEAMVDTNIKGVMYLTQAMLPGMVARGGGHVVNIGSVAASWPYPGGNVYGGTKAFVQQFSRNLRADLLGKSIRVSNIEPGMCETEFSVVRFNGDEDRAKQVYSGMQPLTGTDIAEIVYWVTALPPHINVNQLEVMPTAQAWGPFAVHRV
ncbi:SDR family NAD(P)-dependent oxidoreductase [Pseudomonadales bacterium]|nr:SDR family NAD(P)-dependent oxidoreductase [Pseudomonadales bacterium]MDB9868145.1 SDR family NAD(P)-dependent oxidoreductase [Pseudomonadales bacterium]MDB9880340.1 SDR family NAD(P)-dependent oxidoreductase [Pseudomonadales bacterium]MDB9916867.1 SDR family NAD(P)-dependent oxidoreductase [Pseudomonadales bacterium]MDB9942916.1 SDR family NAD(P)-dependent oxidoreductase [Pseudomonadales bacterium]|tara:strand:+ start:224 stop:976 length:753 start_codon:yes stop_codon:yes gene_type:complete